MESNIRGNAKDITSLKEVDAVAEPYVGMPIYLDDNFFSLLGKGPQCPISDNGDMMDVEIDEDIEDVESMPEQYMPDRRMPEPCPMPIEGKMPAPDQCPMPDQGMRPGQCPMPSEDTMPDKYMPDKYMPDRRMPDKYMPDRCMPDQVMGDYTEIKPGYNSNDCAAGCPLAMAYVPWQSWENTYEDEVAFKVGTVFPSLDLPFLGGKRK